MPVSGRRYRALQQQTAEQRADILRLERELTTAVKERDTARDVVKNLSERNRQLIGRPLTGGEQVLARQLRQSEEARALLAAQIDTLQTANEGAAREAYDLAKTARAVTA